MRYCLSILSILASLSVFARNPEEGRPCSQDKDCFYKQYCELSMEGGRCLNSLQEPECETQTDCKNHESCFFGHCIVW